MTPALLLGFSLSAPAAPPPAAPDVRDTVEKGLTWLAKQQKEDGSWAGTNVHYPTLITSTAGLAFLMEGSTPAEGVYAPNIRKIIAWIERTTRANGPLANQDTNEQFQYIQSHATALLFLACAYDCDTDAERRARVKKLLDKAVAFLADCRSTRGGWGHIRARDIGNYDDSYSTATVLHALLAARKAGIEVPKDLTDKALEYLVKCTGPDGSVVFNLPLNGTAVTRPGSGTPYVSATVAAAVSGSDGPRPAVYGAWVQHASAARDTNNLRVGGIPGLLIHVNVARVVFGLGETGHGRLAPGLRAEELLQWSAYRAKLFKAVKAAQQQDGAWPDQTYGPAYATAVALLILQLDNDFLPAFSR
jgi:hypothetical protein